MVQEDGLFISNEIKQNKLKISCRGKTVQLATRLCRAGQDKTRQGRVGQGRAGQGRAGQGTTRVTSMTNWHRTANTRR